MSQTIDTYYLYVCVYIYVYIYIYIYIYKCVNRIDNNSIGNTHSMFYYFKSAGSLTLAYFAKLHSLLRGQLNRYRYIFNVDRLPYNVVCIITLIAFTETLPC